MLVFWQLWVIDSFMQFFLNAGTQYGSIVLGSAAVGNHSEIGLKVLFEPILGLGTSYRFVKAAQTVAERRARITTLAIFLSVCASSSIRLDPATNIAMGSAIATKIAPPRVILARGGATKAVYSPLYILKPSLIVLDSVKSPVVHPYQTQFTAQSKMIIDNMFRARSCSSLLYSKFSIQNNWTHFTSANCFNSN